MSVRYQIEGHSAVAISASVETGVRTGALPPGTALPPVRALAERLGVAPNTVAAAYRGLRQRGVVETAGRNGTRIRSRPPIVPRAARRVPAPPGTVDLSTGEPDTRLLPRLAPHLRRLATIAGEPVPYHASGPWPELVEAGRERFAVDGVPMAGAEVTVTAGTLDAVERLLSTRLRPGDRVGVEDPGWSNLIDLVVALGLEAVPVAIDDEGPTVDGLQRAVAAGVGAVVVTTRAQNPTGASLTPGRAERLRRVLTGAPDVLVVEDDHLAELSARPPASLGGRGRAWALVRSVSKPYGPDLRVALVAGDPVSVSRVEGRMRLGTGWVSTLLQRLVLELWRDPDVAATVERAGREYDRRRRALLAALARRDVEARGATGINLWVSTVDESAAVAALRDLGWAGSPGSLYRLSSPPGLRLTVATVEVSEVDRLADAVAEATQFTGAVAASRR